MKTITLDVQLFQELVDKVLVQAVQDAAFLLLKLEAAKGQATQSEVLERYTKVIAMVERHHAEAEAMLQKMASLYHQQVTGQMTGQ